MPVDLENVSEQTHLSLKNSTQFLQQRLGFAFNPFLHEDASADENLGDYLVGLDLFALAWDHTSALIYAPGGGGKTAMRIYTIRNCWLGLGGPHPFPVSCIPPTIRSDASLSADAFWHFLARSTAAALLIGLTYRPVRFLQLDSAQAQQVVDLLNGLLPAPLAHYSHILADALDPRDVALRLDRAFHLRDQPNRAQLQELSSAFLRYRPAPLSSQPRQNWEDLRQLIQTSLGFGPIFLLLDGLDGFADTFHHPEIATRWLLQFLRYEKDLTATNVYVKAFLPSELRPLLQDDYLEEHPSLAQAELIWTPELLAEMIRRRVYVASRARAGSLDAFSHHSLRDVETTLVAQSPPWPRAVLRYTNAVLDAWRVRSAGKLTLLEDADIEAGASVFRRTLS